MEVGRIRRLAASDAHHVGSARNAATIESIVEQLVLNAFDAGATSVAVALDLSQFWLSVRDDGSGIEPCELPRVGQLACTSKAAREGEQEDLACARPHGYRGEALFSIGLVSTLEIVSRTAREPAPHMTVLRNGSRVMTCVAPGGRGCGTTATVRDIFYNRPVQRKVLARPGAIASTCERVRQLLARLALAHARVKVSLRDSARGQVLLETHPSGDVVAVLKQLYRALPPRAAFRDVSAASSAPPMRLSAHVCGLTAGTPELQLVYVNRRPLSRRDPLTKLAASVIGCAALAPADAATPPRATRAEADVRFPLFLVFVELPRSHVALADDGSGGVVAQLAHVWQTHERLVELLQRAVRPPPADAQLPAADTPPRARRPPPPPAERAPPRAADELDGERVGKRRAEEWCSAVPPALSKRHRAAPSRGAPDAAARALACVEPRASRADRAPPAWAAFAEQPPPLHDSQAAQQWQRWQAHEADEWPLDELPPRANYEGWPPPTAPRYDRLAPARARAGAEGAGAGFERFAHSPLSPLAQSPACARGAPARAHDVERWQQPSRQRARQPFSFHEAGARSQLRAREAGATGECQLGLLARSDESGTDDSDTEADDAPRLGAAHAHAHAHAGRYNGPGARAHWPARRLPFAHSPEPAERRRAEPDAAAAAPAPAARPAAKPLSAAARKAAHDRGVSELLARLTQRPLAATGAGSRPEQEQQQRLHEQAQEQELWQAQQQQRQLKRQQLKRQLQLQLQPGADLEPQPPQPPPQPQPASLPRRPAAAHGPTASPPPARAPPAANYESASAGAPPPRLRPPSSARALGVGGGEQPAPLALVARRPDDAHAPRQSSPPGESAADFLRGAAAQADAQPLHLTRRLAASARGATTATQPAQPQPTAPTPSAGSEGLFAPLACDATPSQLGAKPARPTRAAPPLPLLQLVEPAPEAAGAGASTALVVRAPAAPKPAPPAQADAAAQRSVGAAGVFGEGSMVLSKQMLKDAHVIGQVDCKWIAVTLGPALALIDQHAADERVQLEALLSQHVGADGLPRHAESVTLEPAEPLVLTPHETSLAREHARVLELWGWHVRGTGAQMMLVRAPSVCSHVLRARALTEYLATLDELAGNAAPPRAVLRAIVSKACRSAIMFGKRLSHEECVAVVAQLARAKFPFQCAHGRPTIVPVLEMSAF